MATLQMCRGMWQDLGALLTYSGCRVAAAVTWLPGSRRGGDIIESGGGFSVPHFHTNENEEYRPTAPVLPPGFVNCGIRPKQARAGWLQLPSILRDEWMCRGSLSWFKCSIPSKPWGDFIWKEIVDMEAFQPFAKWLWWMKLRCLIHGLALQKQPDRAQLFKLDKVWFIFSSLFALTRSNWHTAAATVE